MTSISSSSSTDYAALAEARRQQMFAKLDTDGNGQLSQAEFVAGRPKNVSEADATSLFNKLDSNGTGSLTASQLSGGPDDSQSASSDPTGGLIAQLSADLLALLQGVQQQNTANGTTATNNGTDSKSADMFAKLDTDGDGKLSQAEFVAGRPDGVSEADASALFSKLDSSGSGSIDESQFDQLGKAHHGGGGHDHHVASSTDDTTSTNPADSIFTANSTSDPNGTTGTSAYDQLLKDLAGLENGTDGTTTASATSSTATNKNDVFAALDNFVKAVQSYSASSNYGTTSDTSQLLASV